ncbi:hypothetical protein TNCV_3026451 [Trichonephila clavipes]|nr:hypothetical protein TNCV_3026451 [Trichonephila clavipes]
MAKTDRLLISARDPNTLEESINAALIEEQNLKLNEIASNERSGLSAQAKESAVISALTDKLQEFNLRVKRLLEANTINVRETTKGEFRRKMGVFKCFYCGIERHRQIECRKRLADQRSLDSLRFRRTIRGRGQVSRPSRIQPVNQRRVSFSDSAADNYYTTPRSVQDRYPAVPQGNSRERAFNFQESQNAGALRQNRENEDLNFLGERQF